MPEYARFLRFLVTGGLAALVNVGVRELLSLVIPFEEAVAAAYLAGMAVAFALARTMVFERSGQGMGRELVRFAMVNGLGFAQVWIVSVGLARVVLPWAGMRWHAELMAHVAGVASPVAVSYVLHKRFSFARHPA